jgi:hypothetical protein
MNARKKEVTNSRQGMYPSPSSSDAASSLPGSPEQKRQAVGADVFDEFVPEEKASLDSAKKIL